MGFTGLFTHLKIILLQYFQFSVVSKQTLNLHINDQNKMQKEPHWLNHVLIKAKQNEKVLKRLINKIK